jgi:hypothetical protein
MNKEEVVKIMLDSFEKNNIQLCINAGMSEDEVNEKTSQSRQTMTFLFEYMYDDLDQKGIIKNS